MANRQTPFLSRSPGIPKNQGSGPSQTLKPRI